MTEFTVIIPARFASSRLPGKVLSEIAGKPMVGHVADRARESGAREVIVATDHEGVAQAVFACGYRACMTSAQHPTGTDRVAEVASSLGLGEDHVVVNVQGDEPLIAPAIIRAVAQSLEQHPSAAMATACHRIESYTQLTNPNITKVVIDRDGYALYFSRAPIPYARDAFAGGSGQLPEGLPVFRHIGIYAYRAGFLKRYSALEPGPLERFEALEQLRALWHGFRISVARTDAAPEPGVDTVEDLEIARAAFDRRRI